MWCLNVNIAFNLFFENSFVEFSRKQTNEVAQDRLATSLAPIFSLINVLSYVQFDNN